MRTQKTSAKAVKKSSKDDLSQNLDLNKSKGSNKKAASAKMKEGSSKSVKAKVSGDLTHRAVPEEGTQTMKAQTKTRSQSPSSAKKAAHVASMRGLSEGSGETVCREVACEGLATSSGYCRLHYIKNWKKIKRKELILKEKKLNQYIEELVAKYPDKYIEAIRQDLASDKDFAKVIYDLDLDEGMEDFDVDGADSVDIIDTIKRDFDDEGDTF